MSTVRKVITRIVLVSAVTTSLWSVQSTAEAGVPSAQEHTAPTDMGWQ